jgi:hypothetical protein
MTITDSGVPSTDPVTALSSVIEANMTFPNGSSATVNTGWLESKKQKTYQIAIQHLYGESDQANMSNTTIAMTSRVFLSVTLFAPTRADCWTMFGSFKDMLNTRATSQPAAGFSDYHYMVIRRSDLSKPFQILEPNCGPGQSDENCIGYRSDVTVELRWEE